MLSFLAQASLGNHQEEVQATEQPQQYLLTHVTNKYLVHIYCVPRAEITAYFSSRRHHEVDFVGAMARGI